jgi:hypothetical protein
LETHEKPLIINCAGERLVKNGQREGVFGIFGLNNSVQGSIVPLLPRLFKKTRRAAASNDHGRLFEASSTVVNFNFFSNN